MHVCTPPFKNEKKTKLVVYLVGKELKSFFDLFMHLSLHDLLMVN